MRAAVCKQYGPPSALELTEIPDPVPGPGEVLVDVAYASVNFPDVLFIDNKYQVSVPVPFIPGSEVAGTIAALGEGVTQFSVGQRVAASAMVGAFAQKLVAPASQVNVVPDDLPLPEAAAMWVTYRTAWYAMRSSATVTAGQWVVVLGAAGGVGTALVDLCHRVGAKVVAVASTAEKLELCRQLGADATINYATEDLKVRIKEITKHGADVVFDPVGGPYAEQALRSIAWGGMFVSLGYASGSIPSIPLNLLLLKNVIVRGFDIRGFSINEPENAAANDVALGELIGQGARPHVSRIYPLSDIVSALEDVAGRRITGKIVLDTNA